MFPKKSKLSYAQELGFEPYHISESIVFKQIFQVYKITSRKEPIYGLFKSLSRWPIWIISILFYAFNAAVPVTCSQALGRM